MNVDWISIVILIVLGLWLISLVRKLGSCLIRLFIVAIIGLALIYAIYTEQFSGLL
jgi:hypothetical protein